MIDQWTHIERSYYPPDGVRRCFVEADSAIAGTPLWPQDDRLAPGRIKANVASAAAALSHVVGSIIAGHIPLAADRSLAWHSGKLLAAPTPLSSAYVAAVFLPMTAIRESHIHYHVKDGQVARLSDIALPQKGTWLLSNFGFFMTSKLVEFQNAKSMLHQKKTIGDHSYLGGFFCRTSSGTTEFPPLYPTPGIAITTSGKPSIITCSGLKSGSCTIGTTEFRWRASDVNPRQPGPVAIYTPHFSAGAPHTMSEWQHFQQHIGANRFNIVITNTGTIDHPIPTIAYAHQGSIVQPASAVVLSLETEIPVGPDTRVAFHCDPWWEPVMGHPEVECVYQGLVDLGADHIDWSAWTHPHALMTQETFLPNPMRREPRNIVVQTRTGIAIVSFSGRYELSIGLSWQEMHPVIRRLFSEYWPEETITQMVGLDGGSSVKLCVIQDGTLLPLHWAAPGSRNPFGDPFGNTASTWMMRFN